jgi:hypothetical protein
MLSMIVHSGSPVPNELQYLTVALEQVEDPVQNRRGVHDERRKGSGLDHGDATFNLVSQ